MNPSNFFAELKRRNVIPLGSARFQRAGERVPRARTFSLSGLRTRTWKLDSSGVPIEYQGSGNDYMKAPVEEHFEMKNGHPSWKNRSEQGEQACDWRSVPSADRFASVSHRVSLGLSRICSGKRILLSSFRQHLL
ncbi:MAG: hypothetical protein DLM73_07935 [Chthoniobacterales bacterium]|nr:MAG: hypothetical protein DLM73_07935 [Chthoniobacterales bacterium]